MFMTAATGFAQETAPKPPAIPEISTLPGPSSGDVSQVGQYVRDNFLPRIAVTVIQLAIGSAVLFLIVGSIMMLTAYGSEDKLSTAKKTMVLALAGLGISLMAYVIVQLIFYSGYKITEIK